MSSTAYRITLFTLLVQILASCTSSTSQETGSSSVVSPYSAPPGAPYLAEEVKVSAMEGHVLAGTLTLPKDATKPVAAVVTITGSSPQDRDHNQPNGGDYRIFRQVADTLGRRGIAVLRMDDRGIGMSSGSFESATSEDRANDIRAGIAYLRERPEINPNQIALVGLSEGGLIAPMIATTDTLVSGIVLLGAPASRGIDVLQYQGRYRVEQDPNVAPEQRDSVLRAEEATFLAGPGKEPWFRYFATYDPLLTARRVQNVPVLIIQGETDRNIPPGDAHRLAQAFREAIYFFATSMEIRTTIQVCLPSRSTRARWAGLSTGS